MAMLLSPKPQLSQMRVEQSAAVGVGLIVRAWHLFLRKLGRSSCPDRRICRKHSTIYKNHKIYPTAKYSHSIFFRNFAATKNKGFAKNKKGVCFTLVFSVGNYHFQKIVQKNNIVVSVCFNNSECEMPQTEEQI